MSKSFQIKLVWKIPSSPICLATRNKSYGPVLELSNYVQECEVEVNLSWSLKIAILENAGNTSGQIGLFSNSVAELTKCYPVSGSVTVRFDILEEIVQIKIDAISASEDGLCGYLGLDSHRILQMIDIEDEISVIYELNCTRNVLDTASLIESAKCSLSSDLERICMFDDFSDVTISVKGKNYPAHKLILATRSSVFKAMFRNDMQESQKNNIVIVDIEQDTFEEMLRYIYTGKIANLEESAFELLPAANKYDLKELKNACEGLLITKISAENAGKILVLADMHNAEELKLHALLFIKENTVNFETEIWNVLTESRPRLMKDVLAMFLKKWTISS